MVRRMLALAPVAIGAMGWAATDVCAQSSRMIAIDSARRLYNVDTSTGLVTEYLTATSNAGTTGGLAYDCTSGTVYLTSTSLDSLFTLDVESGAATLIGAYGDTSVVMHGLEWDSSMGTLYGGTSERLFSIDTESGFATLIGATGVSSFSNLGYDSDNDVMYGTNSGADSFYSVDRSTGAFNLIGPLLGGSTNPNAMAYDSDAGIMYMMDNSQDNLYRMDLESGQAILIGDIGASLNILGLVFIPADCGGGPACPGDIADDFGVLGADGMVSFGDFLALLGLVGPCP